MVAAGSHEQHEQQDLDRNQDAHMGYGGTIRTPLEDVPSQAAVASQEAYHDGVNPYTSEPARQHPSAKQDGSYFVASVIASQTRDQSSEGVAAAERDHCGDVQVDLAQDRATVDNGVGGSAGRHQYGAGPSGHNSSASHVNGGVESENERVRDMTAGSVPRSETLHELSLQSALESKASDHTMRGSEPSTRKRAAQRPVDDRTESAATLSNLPIPGKYPRGSGY